MISEQVLEAFKQRLHGQIAIEAGWAPDPPAESMASKLARIQILNTDFFPHHIFWLWRENGEEVWQLVDWRHWAVRHAQRMHWMRLPLVGGVADACLRALPVDFMETYATA